MLGLVAAGAMVLSACGASTSGHGAASTVPSAPSTSAGSTTAGTTSTAADTAVPGGASSVGVVTGDDSRGGASPSGSTASSSTPSASASVSTSPPAGPPDLTSTHYSPPGCTAESGSADVTVSWHSTGGASAWLATSPVYSYVPAANIRTLSGAAGPLAGNGSRTVDFDCTQHYLYAYLGLDNAAGATGVILQIPNPAWQ